MIVSNINEFYTGKYDISKKTFNKAKKIFRILIKKHGVPENQIEINEDSVVHFHVIGEDDKKMHFEISLKEDGMIWYWCTTVDGNGYMINYNSWIEDTIDFLDEFVALCFSEEIYDGLDGELIHFNKR
jgi:hypothetical protein